MIPARPVHWFYEGFIPFRHVTVVLGPAGMSKGIATLDFGARMTRGASAPGEHKATYEGPRDVIVILPEDDPNESVAGRLAGNGAVLERVHNLTVLPDGHHFTVPADIRLIIKAITEIEFDLDSEGNRTVQRFAADGLPRKVGMLILDPLLALSENDLRTRGQARPVMEELEDLARTRHLVILLTHHVNSDGKAASSKAIIETARNVITLGMPPKAAMGSPERVLTVSKTNIGMTGATSGYKLAGSLSEPRVVWAADAPASPQHEHRGYTVQQYQTAAAVPQKSSEPAPAAYSGQQAKSAAAYAAYRKSGGVPVTDHRKFARAA
jgi:hypothetical protein